MNLKCCNIFLLLLAFTALQSCSSLGNAQQSKDAIKITINTKTQKEVKQLMNGFNAANFHYFYKKNNASLNETITQLNISQMRFPGGTVANFYHPFGKAYGYKEQELEHVKGSFVFKNMKKAVQYEKKLINKAHIRKNYIFDFIEFSKKHKIKVLYVANLFTGNEKEILFTLKTMIESGVDVIGVELGNEYYLQAYKAKFPKPDSYIIKAKKIAKAITLKYPKMQIGVVVAPHSSYKEMGIKQNQRMDDWNQKLAEEDFYDAVIIHIYAAPKKCIKLPDKEDVFTCALDENSVFVTKKLAQTFEYYNSVFGNKKDIWLTEWNIHGVSEYFGNTMLQAVYYADFLTEILDYPNLSLANCHNLLAAGSGFNAVAVKGNSISKKSIFYASELLAPLFSEGVRHINTSLDKNLSKNKFKCKSFKKQNYIYLPVINKQNSKVEISELNIITEKRIADIKMNTLYAEKLNESVKTFEKKIIFKETKTTQIKVSDLVLKPYSVNMIRIELK